MLRASHHVHTGSQSLWISSGGASVEADYSGWKRVSVASIGLKGPLSLQLPIPPKGDPGDSAQEQYAQEVLDLMQGWTWVTEVSDLLHEVLLYDASVTLTVQWQPLFILFLFELVRLQGCEESDLTMARYDVNVHVSIGSNPFASSKLVTFSPAVVLCNASNATMHVQQFHSSKLLTLDPGDSQPLIWFNPDAKPELLVQPVCEGVQWSWSGRFTVSEVSSHALRIHSKNDPSHFTILPVSVTTQVSSLSMCTMVIHD
jgi:hypothetical protein